MLSRRTMRAVALALALLGFATTAFADFQNDFSSYPEGAQQCLNDAADASNCSGDTVSAMNECLCGNGGDFVLATAQCVAQEDSGDLESVYEIMSLHCSDSDTPLSISKADFLAAESSTSTLTSATKIKSPTPSTAAATSTTESPSVSVVTSVISGSTITATVTNTQGQATETGSGNENDKNVESTNNTARVGIIAGSVVGGLAIIGAVVFFVLRYRRRQSLGQEEAHPMLSQSLKPPGGGGGPGSIHTQPGSEDFAPTQGWKTDPYAQDWGTANWPAGYGQQAGYGQYPHSPNDLTNAYAHSPNLQPTAVYEMPAPGPEPQRPVEMPSNDTHYSGAGWGSGPYEPYRRS